jgi:hypothetical protein
MTDTNRDARSESVHLPLVLEPAAPRAGFTRVAPAAAFLSQLIAERHHLMTQRQKRRAPVNIAVARYAARAEAAVVRMPSGYRRTVIA